MTHFRDFYSPSSTSQKGHCTFSVEVFPPKTAEGQKLLIDELQKIKHEFNPAYISVTYGAMGSTRTLTEDLAITISEKLNIPTAFHFTCVGSNKEEIKRYVDHLTTKGINLVVALRGDKPSEDLPVETNFTYASELVTYLKTLNSLSIAVAGYPEKHKEARSREEDLFHLKQKVEAGADVIITQMFFNNDDFFRFRDDVQKLNIHVPVVAGLMPIQNLKQIEKITSMCGAKIPLKLLGQLRKYEDDFMAQTQIGIEYATRQCQELIEHKVAGIHFFSLNKSHSIIQIKKSL